PRIEQPALAARHLRLLVLREAFGLRGVGGVHRGGRRCLGRGGRRRGFCVGGPRGEGRGGGGKRLRRREPEGGVRATTVHMHSGRNLLMPSESTKNGCAQSGAGGRPAAGGAAAGLDGDGGAGGAVESGPGGGRLAPVFAVPPTACAGRAGAAV